MYVGAKYTHNYFWYANIAKTTEPFADKSISLAERGIVLFSMDANFLMFRINL
jgi:hypothetical protein